MKRENLDEFDMVLSATRAKEKVGVVFSFVNRSKVYLFFCYRGISISETGTYLQLRMPISRRSCISLVLMRWTIWLRVTLNDTSRFLPTITSPCAHKTPLRYGSAEDWTTKALNLGLITNPFTKAKAFYRRALARRSLGKFSEAVEGEWYTWVSSWQWFLTLFLEDINTASTLHPSNAAIQSAKKEIETLAKSITSPRALAAYIASQPKPSSVFSLQELDDLPSHISLKRADFIDMRAWKAPKFWSWNTYWTP